MSETYTVRSLQLIKINKQGVFFTKKTTTFYLKISNPHSSNKQVPIKKRKKEKGTPPLFYLVDEYLTKIHTVENDFTISFHKFYFFQLFFSDKKRGPPACL